MFKKYLDQIEKLIREKQKTMDSNVEKKKLTNTQMIKILENDNKRVPKFMIYVDVSDYITSQ